MQFSSVMQIFITLWQNYKPHNAGMQLFPLKSSSSWHTVLQLRSTGSWHVMQSFTLKKCKHLLRFGLKIHFYCCLKAVMQVSVINLHLEAVAVWQHCCKGTETTDVFKLIVYCFFFSLLLVFVVHVIRCIKINSSANLKLIWTAWPFWFTSTVDVKLEIWLQLRFLISYI